MTTKNKSEISVALDLLLHIDVESEYIRGFTDALKWIESNEGLPNGVVKPKAKKRDIDNTEEVPF